MKGEWWLPEEIMRDFNWWPFTTTIRMCFKINLRPIKASTATIETLDDNICRLNDETDSLRKMVNVLMSQVHTQQCEIFQLKSEIRNIVMNRYDVNPENQYVKRSTIENEALYQPKAGDRVPEFNPDNVYLSEEY